jgi:hypothetical protein
MNNYLPTYTQLLSSPVVAPTAPEVDIECIVVREIKMGFILQPYGTQVEGFMYEDGLYRFAGEQSTY